MEELEFNLEGVKKMEQGLNNGLNLFWQAVQFVEDDDRLIHAMNEAVKTMLELNGTRT